MRKASPPIHADCGGDVRDVRDLREPPAHDCVACQGRSGQQCQSEREGRDAQRDVLPLAGGDGEDDEPKRRNRLPRPDLAEARADHRTGNGPVESVADPEASRRGAFEDDPGDRGDSDQEPGDGGESPERPANLQRCLPQNRRERENAAGEHEQRGVVEKADDPKCCSNGARDGGRRGRGSDGAARNDPDPEDERSRDRVRVRRDHAPGDGVSPLREIGAQTDAHRLRRRLRERARVDPASAPIHDPDRTERGLHLLVERERDDRGRPCHRGAVARGGLLEGRMGARSGCHREGDDRRGSHRGEKCCATRTGAHHPARVRVETEGMTRPISG